MNYNEFMAKVLAAFPDASVEEDNDGQLVVYTGLKIATSETHPTIAAGDELVIEFD